MPAEKLSYLFLGSEELLLLSGFKKPGKGFEISCFVQKELPSHIISEGMIGDEKLLKELLLELKESDSYGPLQKRKIILVLPDCLVDSKFLQVPHLSKKELSNYLDVEAERLVSDQLSDSIMDYSVLASRQRVLNLHLAAVSRAVIAAYQELMWEVFSRCHGITFRGDLIWPLIIDLSQSEGVILLESHDSGIYIAAGREGFMYLYREENTGGELSPEYDDLLEFVKKADSYLQQELNQPPITKIYHWNTGKKLAGSFTYPRLENGHSWHELRGEKLKLKQCEKMDEFLHTRSPHILPAAGMMLYESL